MHKELVEPRRWIDDARFLHALNYCMLLPGPEATQLATYIGWLMHKTRGGVVAGALFALPGFVAILALSMLYAGSSQVPARSIWFALHVLFEKVDEVRFGVLNLHVPELASANLAALALSVLAMLATFYWKRFCPRRSRPGAALGALIHLVVA